MPTLQSSLSDVELHVRPETAHGHSKRLRTRNSICELIVNRRWELVAGTGEMLMACARVRVRAQAAESACRCQWRTIGHRRLGRWPRPSRSGAFSPDRSPGRGELAVLWIASFGFDMPPGSRYSGRLDHDGRGGVDKLYAEL